MTTRTRITLDKVEQLKRAAKRYKKMQGVTHSEALDTVARQYGYTNWALLMKSVNR